MKKQVEKLDSSFRAQSRKVALVIENYPAHLEIKNLTNINLIFLPPNIRSVLQPIDQGVKPQSPLPKESSSSLYQSSGEQQTTSKDWYSPTNKTLGIIMECHIKGNHFNCFKNSNITQSNQEAAVNDDDDPFSQNVNGEMLYC